MLIKAPAKINLRLEVNSKLDNGYHELSMVNGKIDLYDLIDINKSNNNYNSVKFSIERLNQMSNNYCLDIVNYFSNNYQLGYFDIYITKNIPDGAGLGGGSSDAAALINYFNNEYHLCLNDNELIQLGKTYGADIPYCLYNDICYVEGIGEKITSLGSYSINDIYIICPNIYVPTKDVFINNQKFTPKESSLDITRIKSYLNSKDYNNLLHNDLEESAFNLFPKLKEIKNIISKYGNVVMSGSGSTFILIPSNMTNIDELKNELVDVVIYHTKLLG